MLEFVKFVGFSMIEVLGAIAIVLALFRYKLKDYILPALAIDFIMAIQSFSLREELSFGIAAPLINVILLSLFIYSSVKIPLLWSFVVSCAGYIVSVLFQAVTIALSAGFLTPSNVTAIPERGYILQVWTGIALIVIAHLLYRYGIGLSFTFEKLRFKLEKTMVIAVIVILLISFSVMFYYRTIYFDLVILLMSLVLLGYYLIKKETENDPNHSA